MSRPLRVLVLLVVLVAAAGVLPAPRAAAHGTLSARITRHGRLVDGGQAVIVRVRVACPAGVEVLEAFVYVTQDGNESQFAPIPLVCQDRPRTYRIRVEAQELPFHRGRARASGYVLLANDDTTSPTRVIRLR